MSLSSLNGVLFAICDFLAAPDCAGYESSGVSRSSTNIWSVLQCCRWDDGQLIGQLTDLLTGQVVVSLDTAYLTVCGFQYRLVQLFVPQ